jgi:epoxyqueuosine reductase
MLDDPGFRARFRGSPIKRIGRARFVRNVLIAIGNSGDRGFAEVARALTGDRDALVRGAAVWALSRLTGRAEFLALRRDDPDPEVAAEWREGGSGPCDGH